MTIQKIQNYNEYIKLVNTKTEMTNIIPRANVTGTATKGND